MSIVESLVWLCAGGFIGFIARALLQGETEPRLPDYGAGHAKFMEDLADWHTQRALEKDLFEREP